MSALPEPATIREIDTDMLRADPFVVGASQPWVVRSLVNDWPLVRATQASDANFLDYLLEFYSGNQVSAFLGEPDPAAGSSITRRWTGSISFSYKPH